MNPILLVTEDKKSTRKFLKQYKTDHQIESINVFEIEPQNKEISIDQIRDVKKQLSYSFSEPRLFILYQFHTASYQAQNAFLKTLEEHGENIHFILVVEALYDLLPTVRSRCKVVDIKSEENLLLEPQLKQSLEKITDGHMIKNLSDASFSVSSQATAIQTIDQMMVFFRARFSNDPLAADALKGLLSTRTLILKNNVNPQFALDHFLIGLHKKYLSRTQA